MDVVTYKKNYSELLKSSKYNFNQHQYDGIEWCIGNELGNNVNNSNGMRGGLIADEMGLGKTIQMIGLMYLNFVSRTLIVLPPVLIDQWYNEIYKCTGHKSVIYYGKNKNKLSLSSSPIILTTYNTLLVQDCILLKMQWGRVIFDEAHHLRNHKTKRFKAANKLMSGIKWLVSGTPVQNKRGDLYSLLSLIGLDSKFYKDEMNWSLINKHYILRRTKKEVGIEIPSINKEDISVQWKDLREQRLAEEIHSLLSLSGVSENRGKSFSKVLGDKGKLSALLRARQSCVLPSLMSKSMSGYIKKGLLKDSEYSLVFKYTSKIDAVTDVILKRKDNGKGKIIFCHFTNEIDMIACRLKNEGINDIVKYDGRSNKNINIANKADVLIMQIQTGCEGLNLQEHFSEVYFVSPHWNPCIEDQAIARCHRMGQKETVNVFKFEMVGFLKDNIKDIVAPISMEKYVNKIQNNKRIISREILKE